MNSIITVGITGGIGTGKSLICRILSIMGYPVFYSDNAAKEVLASDAAARAEILHLFGPSAYNGTELNRSFVAGIAFKQPELLQALNQVVHPRVRKMFDDWVTKQDSRVVFQEAAILFESGTYKKNTHNILVVSPLELRITRVMQRDGSTRGQVLDRMKSQWTDEEKIPLADFVIHNNETQMLIPQVLETLKKILP